MIDASSNFEEKLLRRWIAENAPSTAGNFDIARLPPSRRRKRNLENDPYIEALLVAEDDPLLQPLRMAWLPQKVDGVRAARWRNLFMLGDPRDPGLLRQYTTYYFHSNRCRIVIGAPANLSNLRKRWNAAGGETNASPSGLADFVILQAALAL